MPETNRNEEIGAGKIKCKKCSKTFVSERLLHKHMEDHTSPDIKCTFCDFKSKTRIQFMLHMESHNCPSPTPSRSHGQSQICRWFLQGRCKFGDRCWNLHSSSSSDPPQCKFKERCTAWPHCSFLHNEVCSRFQSCTDRSCSLAHPRNPFLAKPRSNLPPDLNSFLNFPNLQRRN